MFKILLAVDGSENSMRAVQHVIKRSSAAKDQYQIELVNVQYPLHGSAAGFVSADQVKQYHHDEGMKVLTGAADALKAGGVPFSQHLFVGQPAEVIARFAGEQNCDEIVIGTRGLSALGGLLVGSVASRIIHLADAPVVLVK
ncbi:universal stress protein [Noviherbaspirillum sp. CPCC 100848]|uniref:Universal stress protein n=1 Tax=Noviherbaspirillum album TaxID=3080276 RepID=A0ABU6J959_9BURK|nr:universal stress protein [Noviherbaspirillum sp. CPCC 100848]MEC4720169.1 universal stress protein [Noviherbaspirillum sp. CPCC 100848]